jgi:hypothetical protein
VGQLQLLQPLLGLALAAWLLGEAVSPAMLAVTVADRLRGRGQAGGVICRAAPQRAVMECATGAPPSRGARWFPCESAQGCTS